ncbi:hypothetical protein AK812_SmicGene14414 [Symbiodinium microadriaticum]|uniref:Uncharacterized protein n=1 Tax=Symbiodinium microadriaticum TaxID=2951 RepID=A0A1Q9E5L1_SYMMI|nr:hypothetical protein AK812_SmicGene14414 [Symbiodinium microadriaticum]
MGGAPSCDEGEFNMVSRHGVVHLHVRKDKETFEFSFRRTLPGEKLHPGYQSTSEIHRDIARNLKVGVAKHDRFKKRDPGDASLPAFCAEMRRYESQLDEKMHLLEILLDQFGLLHEEVPQ